MSDQQFQTICASNGLSSSDIVPLYISRRNIEGSPRQQSFKHSTDRFVFDAEGEISNDWFYNISLQNSRTTADFTYLNDISKSRAINALKISGTSLNPSCISGGECKPWNIFSTSYSTLKKFSSLGVTQEALNYISINLNVNAELSEDQLRFVSSKSFDINNKVLPTLDLSLIHI